MIQFNLRIFTFFILTFFIFSCQPRVDQSSNELEINNSENDNHNHHSMPRTDENQSLSPKRVAMADIGNTHVHIEYSAPSVRGRIIWGGLVAYDHIWVTGAHMATTIEFENDMIFDNTLVPAGKYAFFTIPNKESWTVILNKNWNQHLTDEYDPELNVTQFDVSPEYHDFNEQLRYSVSGTKDGNGFLELYWETLRLKIPISEI
jgi:hypothetical protein